MKIAINVAQFFATAIVSALQANQYVPSGVQVATGGIFLVDTTAKTYTRSTSAGTRLLFNPETQFADFLQIISAGTAPAVAATPAPRPAAVAAPSAATSQLKTVGADGADIRVGDIVRANNPSGTKPKFRLSTTVEYLVDRITAKGAIGLSSPSDHEYLAKRFTKVRSGSTAAANTVSSTSAPVAATPRPVPATDINGRTISVSDYVVVKKATRRDGRFSLVADSIQKVTVVTPKGNVGFGGRDQYLGKRFQKVTLADVSASSVRSGDKLLCVKDGSRAIFNLPKNKALTFRGLTVDGGKFILDGYNEHQYAPSRFKKLVF